MQIFVWSVAAVAATISYKKDKSRTIGSFKKSIDSLKKLSVSLFWMISLIGLLLALIPEDKLVSVFRIGGILGFILVSTIGAIMTVPGPIAFPMAGSLLKLGADVALLASFISTLTMVGIVTLPLEVSYFGKRFAYLRQSFSFLAAIIIGITLGQLL